MINHLVEHGKLIRESHDAIKKEPVDIDLVINENGEFINFQKIERIERWAEALESKKGKARLLLDKPEEVLCYVGNEILNLLKKAGKQQNPADVSDKILTDAKQAALFKHNLYLTKLNDYNHLDILNPVFKFYNENKENGIAKALNAFELQIDEKSRKLNIAFRVGDNRLHEEQSVLDAIIERKEQKFVSLGGVRKCSICGTTKFPVTEGPHGMIKRVPNGNTTGCAFISYNNNAFESYGLSRNENSSVCSNCARNYVESLNHLLNNGTLVPDSAKGDDKSKTKFRFTNRKSFGDDTAVVYWTRKNLEIGELDLLDKPDAGLVGELINSVASGKHKTSDTFPGNQFYSMTLSGATSRIITRDWIEISLDEYRQNIASWFQDIAIIGFSGIEYPSVYQLANATQRKEAKEKTMLSRTAFHLWNAALKNAIPPLWLLTSVLKRITHNKTDKDGKSINTFTTSRASLIRITLNRNNNKNGGLFMNEQLDFENRQPAYLSGRIFAMMESVQRLALGKELNATIRDRFFSAASSSPAPTFGRLMRLTQNHLSKIRQDKPGLVVNLDKDLQELCAKLKSFPAILSLEEQGQFALGYYHQKQENVLRSKKDKNFESLTEENQEE